ncbi:MAG TPA: flagellar basal body rod C-terminal domain-containing protein [Solirubrobacteraceae bacterium]|jgi:flagellar hook-associated protein 1 FlgK|nr:flagellar basal body rod C-terminal domain-containing protein [Solirubrobacteraceae bacterium]
MYISSYLTLDTALSGVEAAQEELDTTGQNISNENTTDYEEQTVNLVEAPSLSIWGSSGDGAMQLGTGVDAAGISNSGDPYLDAAWRQQNAATNSANTTQTYTQQIQTALNEPSTTGLNAQLSTFWSDWNSLATATPNDAAAAQQAVVDDGEAVATTLNTLSATLNGDDPADPTDPTNAPSVAGQVNDAYEGIMEGPTASGATGGTLYNDAYTISSLNYSIVQAQAAGQTPNDLIDQRNAALDNLSTLGNTQVQNNSDGSVTVFFGGVTGTALISDPAGIAPGGAVPPGDNFGTYSSGGTNPGTGWAAAWQSQFASAAGAGTTAASLASTVGGTLGSLVGLAGYSAAGFGSLGTPTFSGGDTTYTPTAATVEGTIGTLTDSLNAVAQKIANEVNNPAVVNGGGATVALNYAFFVNGTTSTPTAPDATGITAANIAVAPGLVAAAASQITPGTVSSNSPAGYNTPPAATATGLSNVQVSSLATAAPAANASDNDIALDEANNAGGVGDDAYQAFVQQVGSLAQGANTQETTQSALQTQITNQRQSVEGVDLSQEMSNLINEQQSYQASAKVMNAFSTVMDALMTVVGE